MDESTRALICSFDVGSLGLLMSVHYRDKKILVKNEIVVDKNYPV